MGSTLASSSGKAKTSGRRGSWGSFQGGRRYPGEGFCGLVIKAGPMKYVEVVFRQTKQPANQPYFCVREFEDSFKGIMVNIDCECLPSSYGMNKKIAPTLARHSFSVFVKSRSCLVRALLQYSMGKKF